MGKWPEHCIFSESILATNPHLPAPKMAQGSMMRPRIWKRYSYNSGSDCLVPVSIVSADGEDGKCHGFSPSTIGVNPSPSSQQRVRTTGQEVEGSPR